MGLYTVCIEGKLCLGAWVLTQNMWLYCHGQTMQQNWGLLKAVGLSSLTCHLLLDSEHNGNNTLQSVSGSERMMYSPRQAEGVCVGFGLFLFFNIVGVWRFFKVNKKYSASHFRLSQKLERAK